MSTSSSVHHQTTRSTHIPFLHLASFGPILEPTLLLSYTFSLSWFQLQVYLCQLLEPRLHFPFSLGLLWRYQDQ
ncbi:hypothetical protein RchiOBHm_Chr2g0085861 [Rosa chinensis]|uniref:Uncharacterized protein n=1 Tax=Rosa chinensis TaxID=74649 RepID=A0A2P6RI82_ROSCH|nr:hypothetical protein RchiOBHm_Chr2g0085861 [Rosa chinensis]